MNSKKPQTSETYDAMFETGGSGEVFDLPYWHSCYYPMYHAVLDVLRQHGVARILEVGCGSGGFAHMILEQTQIKYRGFDFSRVAVERAQKRTMQQELFHVADAFADENYAHDFDALVCTEVLEHISDDLGLVAKWPRGCRLVCSVPNFDSIYHERFFKDEKEVEHRYAPLIAIDQIFRVKKPVLANISLRNRLREIRWNRYRPSRLRKLIGLGDFNDIGGWFIFTGNRL